MKVEHYMGGEIEKERPEPMPGSIAAIIADRLGHLYPFALAVTRKTRENEPADVRAWDLARAWLQREIDEANHQMNRRLAAERAAAARGFR